MNTDIGREVFIQRNFLVRKTVEFHIPFLPLTLLGRHLTMAHGSVLSVQLFGRGRREGVRSNAGRHEYPGQMCDG